MKTGEEKKQKACPNRDRLSLCDRVLRFTAAELRT